jgi:Recombinase
MNGLQLAKRAHDRYADLPLVFVTARHDAIEQLGLRSGATTLRAVAEALNTRGIRTARGGAWYAATVQNLLARAG